MGSMARRDGEIGLNQYRTPGVATPRAAPFVQLPCTHPLAFGSRPPALIAETAFLAQGRETCELLGNQSLDATVCGETKAVSRLAFPRD